MRPPTLPTPFWQRRRWPNPTHEQIVKRSRLLVIDDQDFSYMPLFKRDGYAVEKVANLRRLPEIESGRYDVILLDLFGVGDKESADQGFGVLQHIRQHNPAQLVVAYSNAEWSLDYQPFFEDADAVLHKTKADYYEFRSTVDELLDRRFSIGFYLERAAQELAGNEVNLSRAERRIRDAILTSKSDKLQHYLSPRVDSPATVDRVLQIVAIAVEVARVWTN